MNPPPSTHGSNGMPPNGGKSASASNSGRDSATGRFAKGWRGGKGNPLAGKVAKLRAAMINAVTPKDLSEIIKAMIEKAKAGDVAAARELLDRLLGKPIELDVLEKLEQLEQLAKGDSTCQH